VLEGAFEIWLDGEWQRLHAGQRATAQPAQAHTFRSCGHSARVKMTISPALSFEQYIHRVHTLLSCGKLKGPKDPVGLMYLSMLFQEIERIGLDHDHLAWGYLHVARGGEMRPAKFCGGASSPLRSRAFGAAGRRRPKG